MVALFEPIKKSRLSEHVSMILIKMIKNKVLKTGDQLPSERELAEQFQVSRSSVREALKVMENIGYIESRVGVSGGTFVREITLDSIIDPFTDFLENGKDMILEMLDFRLIIETEFAKLAAREYADSDIKAIELSLVHMKQEISDGGIGLNGDNEFHEAVVQATHNNVFMKMLLMSKSLLSKTREATLRIENQPESSLADHREIYEAIRDRNADAAADLMNQHLRKARENAVSKQALTHIDSGE